MRSNKILWRCCVIAVVLIIAVTLSPLVTKAGKMEPFFLGMPYTLWLGMLMTIFLVVLTYLGGIFISKDEEGEK
jgi:flagellar biosynthesis protein FliR